MKPTTVILAGSIMFAAGTAHATDGNDLHQSCTNNPNGFCLGYISGVVEARSTGGRPTICPPEGAVLGQGRDMVIKFLRDKPELRHVQAPLLISTALFDWWCLSKEPQS